LTPSRSSTATTRRWTLDDWTEVNYLIKTLKKARDDAFGRPE